jgi:mycoredoxin
MLAKVNPCCGAMAATVPAGTHRGRKGRGGRRLGGLRAQCPPTAPIGPLVRNAGGRAPVVRGVNETPDAITFYWRPGCGFCMGLERGLSRIGVPLDKRNIWEDPDAAATVRSIANGNETVPTVVVGDTKMVNPSVAAVLDAVRDQVPHLEAADR